jgi:ATP-dependent protease ClpP protease subunit
MKKYIFTLLTLVSMRSYAGQWDTAGDENLFFSGPIQANEYEQFAQVFTPKVKYFVVDSDGGDVAAAIKIANVIADHDITVVVNGACISSCANYFFTAGKKKIIRQGFVAFHGDWKAWKENPESDYKSGLARQAPEKREALIRKMDQTIEAEQQYLKKVGVSQALFDKTEIESDRHDYDLFLPSLETFEKYGIKNILISGDPKNQDIEEAKDYVGKNHRVYAE